MNAALLTGSAIIPLLYNCDKLLICAKIVN